MAFIEMPSALSDSSTTNYSATCQVMPYGILASLYDVLLGDRFFRQLRHTFERLIRRYGIRFSSVADIACGTGTFVRYLRERGVQVVYGVDRSPGMLRLAAAKNQHNGARFLRQDLRTLQLPQPVDLITCHFDSMNYLLTGDDLRHTLHRVHANLHHTGHVIFDMITDRPPWQGLWPRTERVHGADVLFIRTTYWDPRRDIQIAIVSMARNGQTYREIHVQRGYSVASVSRLLTQSRFKLLGAREFQSLGPARPWTRRIVYVAQKG